MLKDGVDAVCYEIIRLPDLLSDVDLCHLNHAYAVIGYVMLFM